MPNIEIHGVHARKLEVRWKIMNAFEGADYRDHVVVTWYPSEAWKLDDYMDSFLRILATADSIEKHLDDILRRLEPVDMDIEVLTLDQFSARKKKQA